MGMLLLIWILNFVISWVNAWGCGKSWNETKAVGGGAHFMNWMGAIMSASGFTWCYLVIAGFFGASVPFEHEVAGRMVNEPYLSGASLEAFVSLGYLMVVFPILGSGIAITINSWRRFAQERSLATGAETAWNTFAMGHNIYSAVQNVPTATSSVFDYFKGSDEKGKGVILLLVLGAACAGILTTYTILTTTARSTARERLYQAQLRQAG